jgi:hypothetical protein
MKMLVLVAVSVLTIACSPLLHPGGYQASRYGRPGMVAAEPVPIGRWDNVMRLPGRTTIDVLTRDGRATVGGFADADEQYVRLFVGEVEVAISRFDVVRVDLVSLPGSTTGAVAKRATGGAILGTAGAAIIAGVIGGHAWPPPGSLLRAGAASGPGLAARQNSRIGARASSTSRQTSRVRERACPQSTYDAAIVVAGFADAIDDRPAVGAPKCTAGWSAPASVDFLPWPDDRPFNHGPAGDWARTARARMPKWVCAVFSPALASPLSPYSCRR